MRKLMIAAVVLLLAGGAVGIGYNYIYHDHLRVEDQDAAYRLGVAQLEQKFLTDAAAANIAYGNKVVEVTGKITAIDVAANVIVIDQKLYVECANRNGRLRVGETVRVKGRFVGYDDLLGELRMDQAIFPE